MAISWPFDSTVSLDTEGNPVYSRTYSANVLARILQKYFRNGVFSDVSTNLQVMQADGMRLWRSWWLNAKRVAPIRMAIGECNFG